MNYPAQPWVVDVKDCQPHLLYKIFMTINKIQFAWGWKQVKNRLNTAHPGQLSALKGAWFLLVRDGIITLLYGEGNVVFQVFHCYCDDWINFWPWRKLKIVNCNLPGFSSRKRTSRSYFWKSSIEKFEMMFLGYLINNVALNFQGLGLLCSASEKTHVHPATQVHPIPKNVILSPHAASQAQNWLAENKKLLVWWSIQKRFSSKVLLEWFRIADSKRPFLGLKIP